MASSSIILHSISPTCYYSHHHHYQNRSNYGYGRRFGGNRVMMTASASTTTTKCSSVKPWLMLPPLFKGGDMLYKFYSLQDEQVFTFNKRPTTGVIQDSDQIPPDDAKLVGSSHGWLASFDDNTNHVFLSNPISGRHIKLPAIDTLPDPHVNLFEGRGSVSRVILSCSPDEPDTTCHAMITFGPGRRLAFCTLGVSTDWTPLDRPGHRWKYQYWEYDDVEFARRPWEDMVYWSSIGGFSTIQPLAFGLDRTFIRDKYGRNEKHCEIYHWDIPEKGYIDESFVGDHDTWNCEHEDTYVDEDARVLHELHGLCIQMPHLVCLEPHYTQHPLIVQRFMHRGIGDDSDEKLARPDLYRANINTFPYRSVYFRVLRCETFANMGFCSWSVVKDLKGLAFFVGMNHAFAVPATGKLKPNSIYFTDAGRITPPDPDAPKIYGGHDIGIYDYENKTVSPCYYPCDFESFNRIDPPPMWFTPSPSHV